MLRQASPLSCPGTPLPTFPSILVIGFSFFCCLLIPKYSNAQQRVFVLTDIENEPDDAMSMVRFLVYANHFDIEGLAATTSIHQQNRVATYRIREIVEAFAQVRDQLAVCTSFWRSQIMVPHD